jgi:hypothetical protein
MLLGNPMLKGLDSVIFKFDNLPAVKTDQVIMVSSFLGGFIAGFSIGKFSLGCQTQPREELKGPIDRRITDPWIQFRYLSMNLGKIFMPGRVEEDIEYLCSLAGGLDPFFRNK